MLQSFFTGLLSLIVLFFICLVVVIGIKSVIIYFNPKPVKPIVKPAPKKRKPKTVRSISIDPEQIDRIYVKKIS